MNLGDRFRLTLFTNRPALALAADRAGVDRIGPDLERLGKLNGRRSPRSYGACATSSGTGWRKTASTSRRR